LPKQVPNQSSLRAQTETIMAQPPPGFYNTNFGAAGATDSISNKDNNNPSNWGRPSQAQPHQPQGQSDQTYQAYGAPAQTAQPAIFNPAVPSPAAPSGTQPWAQTQAPAAGAAPGMNQVSDPLSHR